LGEQTALPRGRDAGRIPDEIVAQMRQAPFRPGREKIAHTLVYEARLIGDLALPPDLLPGAFAAAPDAKAAALILTGSGPLDRDSTGPRFRGEIGLEIARVLASHSVGSCATTSLVPARAKAITSTQD
jgi:hypothetical protein